jgi:dihydrodipicolinate synthase/N-acetylneuraminate lyase
MKKFRGIYGILTAAYKENMNLDEESIRRQVDFCIRGKGHGIVVPVNASEFIVLSDQERKDIIRWTVEETAGRVPVIAGITTQSTYQSIEFARYAKNVGADGVIAMPPYSARGTDSQIVEFYQRLGDESKLPIFVQNYVPPIGTTMSPELCIRIIKEAEYARYVKEETQYSGHVLTQIEEMAKELPEGTYCGTMGGKAGRYLIDEYRRGACGNMPACDIVDVDAKVWELLDEGKFDDAVSLYNKAVPLMNMEYMYGYTLYKVVLKKRGIIATDLVRVPGSRYLDELDNLELDRILHELEPYFEV